MSAPSPSDLSRPAPSPAEPPSPVPTPVPATAPAPRTHTPGDLGPKLAFLAAGLGIFAVGFVYLWEPLGRILFGETADVRVAEIRVVEPGRPVVVYNYRREYPPESNLAITFQHHVAIPVNGRTELFRLSVDSRKAPVSFHNVNDPVRVAYYLDDPRRLAFAVGSARTWGAATILCGVGLVILVAAIPMAFAARRPIVIDPEAPSADSTAD